MTVFTFQQLFLPTVLTAGTTTIYTCPASPSTNCLKNGRLRFSNTTGGAVTVLAYAVPSGGGAGAGNEFMNNVSIAGNSYLDVDLPTLAAGDTFQASASAGTSITVFEIGGVLFT